MTRNWPVFLFLCILALAPCWGAQPGKPKPKSESPKPPTKATVLALADGYIATMGPKLTGTDFHTINTL